MKTIQSLKQNLKKRVMEYKTMNHINITSKETQDKVDLNISRQTKGRCVPVTKVINNWLGSKLPWKWSKFADISPPYVYWTRSYKW